MAPSPVRLPLIGVLVASLALGAAPRVWAASQREQIERARQLIDEAEFEAALRILNDAISQPDNSDQTLAQLYQLQGITYLYLGREQHAREAFEKLLQANPLHELPKSSSPKVRQLFESVRQDVRSRRVKPVRIVHDRITEAPAGQRLDVRAQIEDLPEGARARLHYRRSGNETYSSAQLTADGDGYVAYVPAFELPAEESRYGLEYYLEVADAAGRRLAGVGSALAPLVVRVNPPAVIAAGPGDEDPLYKKWWFWAIAGGVVAGAATGAYFVVPRLLDDTATVPVTIRVQP